MLQSALGWQSSKPRDESTDGKPLQKQQKPSGTASQGVKPATNPNWKPIRPVHSAPSDGKASGKPGGDAKQRTPILTGGNLQPLVKAEAGPTAPVKEKQNPLGPDGKPRWTHCFNCRERRAISRENALNHPRRDHPLRIQKARR